MHHLEEIFLTALVNLSNDPFFICLGREWRKIVNNEYLKDYISKESITDHIHVYSVKGNILNLVCMKQLQSIFKI